MSRILLIEDNQANLELMSYLLGAYGHVVRSAMDGADGLEAARTESFDLIACDINMPVVDGYEVARRLKADPALRTIPLVAVTALAMVGDRDKVLSAGFDGYIAKPIDPEAFVRQVEVFLRLEDRQTAPHPNASVAASPTNVMRGQTVLVVDNLPVNLYLARSILEPRGYRILTAAGMREGLALVREQPCDLILSDVCMSEGSGYDFIREVKADLRLMRIPFVFLTSTMTNEKDRAVGLALGAVRFLFRPIEPDALLAEIETCLAEAGKGVAMATILIVDDRPTNREFLVTLLGYGGHRLLEAGDGAEGLALTRAERPDLVIADILMPTMDGYDFVRRLRAEPAIAHTRVIFYTAHYHEPEARRLAAACGVFDVLTKPCEPEVVLRTVETALGHVPFSVAPAAAEFDREHLHLLTDKLSGKADELRRANERLTAMVELGLQLGSERDPARLLQLFCDAARQIVGARFAIVGISNGGASSYRYFLTSGMDVAIAARLDRSVPLTGVLGSVLTAGRCFRAANHGGLAAAGVPPSFPASTALLAAPVLSPARVHGWVCLLDKLGADSFTDEDEQLARMLGGQVGRIFENGSLYADLLRHTSQLAEEVAERKRAEAELRQSTALLQAVAAGTTDAVFVKDREGKYLLFNEAAARFVGKSVAEVLGKDDTTLFDPIGAQRIRVEALSVMESEQVHTTEEELTAAGVTRIYLATQAPYRDDGGRVIGIIGIARDITDRKHAEVAVRQAQQRLQRVLASSPAVLYTLAFVDDQIRGISWISDNLQEMLGFPASDAFHPDWWHNHIHPDDRERVMTQTHADLLSHGHTTHEYRFRHRDGEYRWTRGEIRLIRDAAAHPVEAVGSWSDITQRRQLEEQFRQAQKMEAIGRLAGGVAHDFNNLLTIINGYGELVICKLPAGDPSRDLIREMVSAGERAAGLTRQLLAFSRKAIIEPRELDLTTVVTNVQRMLRRIIGEDIALVIAADPETGVVKADAGQIEQVILNLVVNARDAMPTGGRITIEVRNAELDESYSRDRPDTRPGPYVLLAVNDTGCGMDAATISRIFEPFFSTKGEHGTGLGLATVHGIVKQGGGHIAVYSKVGHGTTFKVYLPRVEKTTPVSKSRPNPAAMPHGGETILLVEDEDAVRGLARRVLVNCGYTVLDARDGVEAVRLADQHRGRIDLLVTDVIMPRMGGRQVAERLSEMHSGVRVLFLSGYTDDAVVRHGILEAEVAFLQKPFTPASLAAKVRETLDTR